MANIDKKFIVNLQGKEFVTYEGLLDVAHQMKLKSIETDLIQIPNSENGNTCIAKAVAKTEDGKIFHGYGDADPSNVNKLIARHLIRMAETRAKARALRDLTNVGMTAVEEIGGDEIEGSKQPDDDLEKIREGSYASDKQLRYMYQLVKQKNYGNEAMAKYIKQAYNKDNSKHLTKKEASELINMLQGMGE